MGGETIYSRALSMAHIEKLDTIHYIELGLVLLIFIIILFKMFYFAKKAKENREERRKKVYIE